MSDTDETMRVLLRTIRATMSPTRNPGEDFRRYRCLLDLERAVKTLEAEYEHAVNDSCDSGE